MKHFNTAWMAIALESVFFYHAHTLFMVPLWLFVALGTVNFFGIKFIAFCLHKFLETYK